MLPSYQDSTLDYVLITFLALLKDALAFVSSLSLTPNFWDPSSPMASSYYYVTIFPKSTLFFSYIAIVIILSASIQYGNGSCYTSIFSFGDSLADTGNLLHLKTQANGVPGTHAGFFPYGETYFHYPTGRYSNGRLIIDFLAESLGLPLVPPYIGVNKNVMNGSDFRHCVNFAVAGATALDTEFLEQMGVPNKYTNVSLHDQLAWFKTLLSSLCSTPSDCTKLLQSSLILMGEIGGNDYNHALVDGGSLELEEVKEFVSLVVNSISSAITELIEIGAVTFVVPGNFPIGCSVAYLSSYDGSDKKEYDPETGCIIKLNKFAERYNEILQRELNLIRQLHPHANIIYADYYNAAAQLYTSPHDFGFTRGALSACCGGGGRYNYNSSVSCGDRSSTVCDEPNLYANWDGLHLTEAAYRWIFKGLFEGPYTTPQFSSFCPVSVPLIRGYSTN